MFGAAYISQHVRQAYAQEQKAEAYRVYIAETLRCIGENTSHLGGSYVTAHWADIAGIALDEPEDTSTPQEVVDYMKKRLSSL